MLSTKALRGSQKAWRFPAQVSQKASEAPKLRGVPSSSRGSQELPETPVKILELAEGSHAICTGVAWVCYGSTMAVQWKWHRRCPGVFPECYGRGTGAVHERYREAGE